jgi:mycothiol synthase
MAASRSTPPIRIRDFTDADYEPYVAIANANYPDNPLNADELRHEDSSWNHEKYFFKRYTAVDESGQMIGSGELLHRRNSFHPDKYWMDLYVDPAVQRRGYGSAIYEHLLGVLRERGATEVRGGAQESKPEVVSWLEHRGFTEARRSWESRLPVQSFDFSAFATAEERASSQGIVITTLADELAQGREEALKRAHDLYVACNRDVPGDGEYTPPVFDDWIKRSIERPDFLPEAYLIAKEGGASDAPWVGMSALWKMADHPDVLHQGITGVVREYRGKGVAMALKVRGVHVAQQRGIQEIRTFNDTSNRPMLRINEAMGFLKRPAWIIFAKALGD